MPLVWRFRTDPDNAGIDEKWYHPEAPRDDDWSEIRTNAAWTDQGHAYHGAAWYRIDFSIPSKSQNELHKALDQGKAALLFRAVDGTADIFLDGEKIGEQKIPPSVMWNRAFAIPLPATMDPSTTHRLVVRVEKDLHAAGIWKPVSLVVVDTP